MSIYGVWESNRVALDETPESGETLGIDAPQQEQHEGCGLSRPHNRAEVHLLQ